MVADGPQGVQLGTDCTLECTAIRNGLLGPNVRQTAARVTWAVLEDPAVEVLPHTSESFMEGLKLYEARLDKSYSMVDCMSMVIMQDRDIQEVLTNDDHFAQEGFTVLLGNDTAG